MRINPPGDPLFFPAGPVSAGGVAGFGKANSSLNNVKDHLEDLEELADQGQTAQWATAIDDLRKKVDNLEAEFATDPQKVPGKLFRLGRVGVGWEDVILLLVLIVVFGSWMRGSMTTQDTLVALMGAGAGGIWGATTVRGSS